MGSISSVSASNLNMTDDLNYCNDELITSDNSNELIGNDIDKSKEIIKENNDKTNKISTNNINEIKDGFIEDSNKPNLKSKSLDNDNVLSSDKVIYFDASINQDGDGSKDNPYKYLYSNRINSGFTAYFADGTYELSSTCILSDVKLIGQSTSRTIITSKAYNQYDFIIKENSNVELEQLSLNYFNILNQGTLTCNDVTFEGNDVFDADNSPEIKSGSGLFNSSFGGVIVCDTPKNIKTTLSLNGCYFKNIYDAYIGGAIAAINSNILISNSVFFFFSSMYKGGAIYCLDSNLNMYNVRFEPNTQSNDGDYAVNRYDSYTSYYGGSIFCENSEVILNRIKFDNSISFSFGGCIASLNSNIVVFESNFTNSLSLTDGGGAIYNSKSELHISHSNFKKNSAEFGGSICNINSILNSKHTWYVDGSANRYGGIIYDIYGTINLEYNHFGNNYALIGGSIYTRIPNEFNLYNNYIGDSYAQEGASIFFDGKSENINYNILSNTTDSSNYDELMIPINSTGLEMFNYYSNDYYLVAEFNAKLNGKEYYIISNPLYYSTPYSENTYLFFPWSTYYVDDGLVRMMIFDSNDTLTSISTDNILRNVSANIQFSDKFTNPTLNFYLFGGNREPQYTPLYNYFGPNYSNLYLGTKEDLFKDAILVGTYSIDLSNKGRDNNYNITEYCPINFGNPFLSIKYDNLYDAPAFISVPLINNSFSNSGLSSDLSQLCYYNSNDYGFVSSVKDQKNGGNCWAFAGLATLETCLKKATGVTYDFSEENAKNLMAAYSVFGLKIETNYGGYDSMLMSYLTSWLGPIDESIEYYDDYSAISILENPIFHIQNIKFLPARKDSSDNELYKMAIRDNGAVSIIFKWGKDYHAVSLVGWDDNYENYDSLGNYAKGAWIFKNSFGSEWGNNGFGYLSYEQKISEQLDSYMHAYTFIFNDNNPYTKVYQYDFAGVSEFYIFDNPIYFKNNFIAENDSLLSAFSTYFDRETNYTVKVYKNNQLVLSQSGNSLAGYYTIPFDNFVPLEKGDEFSILLENHNTGYNSIPVCKADEINKKTFTPNVSFINYDGQWYDLYDHKNSCHVACIKAFTQNINLKSIKINVKEFDSVKTNNFNIKFYFDEIDDINSINFGLVKVIIDDVNTYYSQIKNGVASLNLNLANGVHSLWVQYKDNLLESNIIKFNFTVHANPNNQSFNALQDIINDALEKSTVNLTKDYFYDEFFDDADYGVNINKVLTINGNGHIINGLSKSTAFYISANNVVLNDIIFNNTFSTNGGSIYIAAHNVTLNNCSFINSHAIQSGGGIYSLFDINLNNCKFINNSANMGGGLYLINTGILYIKNSYFDNNIAQKDGSAIYINGIGTSLISSTNFTNNIATYNGGAILSGNKYVNLTNCLFKHNSANSGGSIFSNSHKNKFTNCTFLNNIAKEGGGAITAHNTINIFDSKFINNSITGNSITGDKELAFGGYGGGAIYSFNELNIYNSNFINNSANTCGGAIYTSKYLNIFKSNFTNNHANSGGAIYNNPWQMMKISTSNSQGILHFTQSHYYDSNFVNNYAPNNGGAIYSAELTNNCTFINNSANCGGAIYDAKVINSSSFINNSAEYAGAVYADGIVAFYSYNSVFINNHANGSGGAIYCHKYDEFYYDKFNKNNFIYNSSFISNSANRSGGVIYSMSNMNIYDSRFVGNLANYGGAINSYGDDSPAYLNISSCNFDHNFANISGGAIYSKDQSFIMSSTFVGNLAIYGGAILHENGTSSIKHSSFTSNSADFGGAIYLHENGTSSIKHSSFTSNSADFGGAIFLYSEDEKSMAHTDIYSCNFDNNHVNKSGGAIYSDGQTFIADSTFIDNSANWGSAIFSNAYLDLRNSNIKSNQDTIPVYFAYHYYDNNTWYGDLYLSNNKIDSKYAAINYDEEEIPYQLPLYLVFNNVKVIKGQYISICRLEDADGNPFYAYGMGDLEISLTNQNNKEDIIKFTLKYNEEFGGYYLNTSSIAYGTYKLNGALTTNKPGKYTVKEGILQVLDESGRTTSILTSTDITTTYGNNDKLIITLKDSFGNPIPHTFININLNGKTTTLITNEHGQASLTINLAPKTYIAYISFNGNEYYLSASSTAKIIVKKAKTKIIASKKAFKLKTKTKKYTITLKNNIGKVIKKVKVTIKIKGKTYKATTNNKGKATFKLKINKKGKYKSTIKFGGNNFYNAISKKVTITVK